MWWCQGRTSCHLSDDAAIVVVFADGRVFWDRFTDDSFNYNCERSVARQSGQVAIEKILSGGRQRQRGAQIGRFAHLLHRIAHHHQSGHVARSELSCRSQRIPFSRSTSGSGRDLTANIYTRVEKFRHEKKKNKIKGQDVKILPVEGVRKRDIPKPGMCANRQDGGQSTDGQ